MRRALLIAVLLLACGALSGCRRNDFRTITIDVPEMKNAACAAIVAESITRAFGVPRDSIVPDLSRRTVTVTYDSLTMSLKNIEACIAGSGFAANTLPASPEAVAKLPPECR